MGRILDLFGDPVPANHGKRGRPQHIATRENKSRVNVMLAFGWSNERIASALRITLPTLHKHYFYELEQRAVARDRLDMMIAMQLVAGIKEGNVGAIKEFRKLQQANDLMTTGQASPRPNQTKPEKEPKLGKKEAAALAAQNPDTETTLGDLMARRQQSLHS